MRDKVKKDDSDEDSEKENSLFERNDQIVEFNLNHQTDGDKFDKFNSDLSIVGKTNKTGLPCFSPEMGDADTIHVE